ncbi:uncharacterized protein PHALS_07491 [Plasmopara halstedii]|uniref:Uncharacterized protein n=1 Tax=Plasmopara halstedii TaxID=4781 RepID=A0A0P1B5X5_PLAHL|nr:uncharacterized protein PHALS_07491 [Plasmopara halstedii]CEG49742.1 hypothetical protein PHALS_07491 [Plasmopara halstedii]|eukprot:XP_024586111.1 hypothetical protein PHALS_07491 [Plasmopara halstedii]
MPAERFSRYVTAYRIYEVTLYKGSLHQKSQTTSKHAAPTHRTLAESRQRLVATEQITGNVVKGAKVERDM